ncbi:hypothetical protein AGMMS4956_04340 [Bacteroidia bacterium]|nr:hypothetical protein AGMMS4956_04340 [Bacteroidia bacterium]
MRLEDQGTENLKVRLKNIRETVKLVQKDIETNTNPSDNVLALYDNVLNEYKTILDILPTRS